MAKIQGAFEAPELLTTEELYDVEYELMTRPEVVAAVAYLQARQTRHDRECEALEEAARDEAFEAAHLKNGDRG